jgi:YHS domain-containing protein
MAIHRGPEAQPAALPYINGRNFMVNKFGWLCLVLALVCTLSVSIADEKKDGKEKAAEKSDKAPKGEAKFECKCPVSGADAKKEQATAYKDKEVYFCCEKCKAAFEKDNSKFTAKANHQLVQTKQYRQTSCPLSGEKVDREQTATVAGVKVAFCCEKCKGAIQEASAEDKITKIFADDVFAKSFAVRKAEAGGEKKGKGKGKKAKAAESADAKS